MTGSELATTPRERFAERFALLYAEAGNPPLKKVTESVHRARRLDERGRPVRVTGQRVSDWRRGRNVPARFAGLAAVLQVLIGEARKRRAEPVLEGLYDLAAWQELWQQALATPISASSAQKTDSAETPVADDSVCPYRGLAPFRQSDSSWFFGRERSTRQLLGKLRRAAEVGGFVMVVGASGAGKSSLLRAGLGPSLAPRTLNDAQTATWPVVAITPGRAPLHEVAEVVDELAEPLRTASSVLDEGGDPATEQFVAEVRSAVRAFAERTGGPGAGVVLVVDQLEELFTLTKDEDERLLFLRVLQAACSPSPGFRAEPAPGLVVMGVRADFYDRCLRYPAIVEATHDRQLALGAMTAQELRDAVVRPAKAVGLQLERGLVELMLADLGAQVTTATRGRATAGYDAGALPLLSHALLATWQRRSSGKLTIAGYRAAGGIHGAVAATAERTWESLDAAEQAAARRILLHLVQVGETTRDVRRRATRAELVAGLDDASAAEQALESLAAARLVTLDADSVEISHEALLEAWPRLRSWIDDNRAENLLRQRLEADAQVWDAQGRDASLLYRGARLESAMRLSQDERSVDATPVARAFLDASARNARRNRWVRRGGVALVCVLALIAATAAAIAIDQRNEAEYQQIVAASDNLQTTDPSLAAQLAMVAHRERPDDPAVTGRLLAMQHAPLATPLRGHRAAVYLGKFRPDGKVLATASEDRTVQLWRLPDKGSPVRLGKPLTGHDGWVGVAIFTPDGRTLATAGEDGTIRMWDVTKPEKAKPLGTPLDGRHGIVYMIHFSPDGKLMATAHGDGSVRIWDMSDPARPRWKQDLTGHTRAVRSVAFSPDGEYLVSGSDDHDARLWRMSNGKFSQLGGPLKGAADKVHATVFSPDGHTLAVAVEDGTVQLWDVSKPNRPKPVGGPLSGHEGLVWELSFSPDGRTLASASSDGTARLWNVARPERAGPLGRPLAAAGGIVYAVEFSPDGEQLLTTSEDGVSRLWTLPPRRLPGHADGVAAVAVSPNGNLLATGGADQVAQLWQVGPDRRPRPVGPPLTGPRGVVGHLEFHPNGRLLAVGNDAEELRLWRVDKPGSPKPIGEPLEGSSGYFSKDGRVLVVVNGSVLRLYDIADPAKPTLLSTVDTGQATYVTSVAFSPNKPVLATGAFDKTVLLWDVSDPEKPRRIGKPLQAHRGPVWAVQFRPDGEVLATASGDRTVRLWDVRRPERPTALGEPLRGHTDAVTTLAFGPDGDRLVTGSYDKTIRIWSVRDRTSTSLPGHTGIIEDVAMTDGGEALSASSDGTARLWDLRVAHSARRICDKTASVLTEAAWERHIPYQDYDPPCR